MNKSLLLGLFLSSSILLCAQPLHNSRPQQPQNPVGDKHEQPSAPRNPIGENSKRGEWTMERGKPGFRKDDSPAIEQYNEAMNYYNGFNGYKHDFKKAYSGFSFAAEKGNYKAQYQLGICYYYGRGIKSDKKQAVEWWHKSAEAGFSPAQYELGRSYYTGEGVKRNYDEAIKWLTKSANSGNANAQYLLGEIYYNGHGVVCDHDKADKYWQQSAKQGNRNAIEKLEKHQKKRK